MSSCSFVWRNLRGICRYSLFTKKNDLDLVVNFKYATSRNANTKRPSNCVNHKNDDNVKHHAENVSSPNDLVEMDKKRGVSTKMPETLERIGGDGLLRIGDSCHRSKKVSNRNKYGNILRNGYNLNIVGEIVFGINPVTIALDVKRRSFNQLFIKRTTSLRQNKRLTSLEAFARNLNITVHKVETPILNHLSGNRAHQGVCLDAGRLEFQSHIPEESDCELADGNVANTLWVLLDRIQDPMNFGAVLRSCYYFGVNRVLTVGKNSCSLTPVVSKASSGAMEALVVYEISQPVEFLKSRLKGGWNVIGAVSQDAIQDASKVVQLNDFMWPARTILLIGSEGDGISAELVELCNFIVTIPQKQHIHPNVQSLNVSVATGRGSVYFLSAN